MLMFGCIGLGELGSEENENKKMGQQYTVKQLVQIQEMTSSPDTTADDCTGVHLTHSSRDDYKTKKNSNVLKLLIFFFNL